MYGSSSMCSSFSNSSSSSSRAEALWRSFGGNRASEAAGVKKAQTVICTKFVFMSNDAVTMSQGLEEATSEEQQVRPPGLANDS